MRKWGTGRQLGSVRPSVRPSHSCIVLKRLKIGYRRTFSQPAALIILQSGLNKTAPLKFAAEL